LSATDIAIALYFQILSNYPKTPAGQTEVIYGGLGSAVAEILVESHPISMQRIGVCDTFAEFGS
jgi:hypothetical protein